VELLFSWSASFQLAICLGRNFKSCATQKNGSGPSELTNARLRKSPGLEAVDLSTAFDSVANHNRLLVAKWDDHTTALGHRLLADKLYQGLVPLLFGSSSKQEASNLQKR